MHADLACPIVIQGQFRFQGVNEAINMTFGWIGKILRVELSKEKIESEDLKEEDMLNFLGGRGLSAKILFDELKPNTDPLGPDNLLIFNTGPLIGSRSPSIVR